MIRYSAILLSILLFGFMVPKHEFYVTITDLIVSNDTLQVAIKVFTHHFEEVIKEEGGEVVFLDEYTNQDIAFRKIKNYCAEHDGKREQQCCCANKRRPGKHWRICQRHTCSASGEHR